MTTNYFDNLPISTELQLALSALIAPADVESAGYSYSGTYAPVISDASDPALTFGYGAGGDGETLYFTRIGSGTAPSAGDTVHVFGLIQVNNRELTDSVSPSWSMSLPTGAGDVWFPEPAFADMNANMTGNWLGLIAADSGVLTVAMDGDLVAEGFQFRWIDLTYQVGAEPA